MNKKRLWASLGIIVLICIIFIGKSFVGTRPFKELVVEDIIEVTAWLIPPDIKLALTEEEVNELVGILNRVVIYTEDNTYRDYTGQAVIFTIAKTDGTQISINAYNPFIIIDGTGYKTKYKPCEELSSLANNLDAGKDG